jgi:superfamily II RNA helicase
MRREADPALGEIFSRIGKPASVPFKPDPFQLEALAGIKENDCLVTAPTGAGKTWIAERVIHNVLKKGGHCWYASPLKALTNSKWIEFGEIFGSENVGILTGDMKENPEAPVIVGTTEILRNHLYDAMRGGEDLDFDLVVLDEAHYLGDSDRGFVWEEVLIYLPVRVNLLLLSATVGNSREVARWLSTIRNKRCTIVEEKKRPVPLYPLFMHPAGRIMPFLSRKRLYKKIAPSLPKNGLDGSSNKPYPFGELISILRKFNLLPAIFFLKSREECNRAVTLCKANVTREDEESFRIDMDDILERAPYLRNHKQLHNLYNSRVGAHHGGQFPIWKFVVETMMKKGYLDAVFATSTVAAGVNFPARTVVMFNSDRFNGREFVPLDATEFHQMTGRAGRRGIDKIGFMLVFPGKFMDVRHLRNLSFQGAENVESQLRNDFTMVLNLLLSHRPAEVRDIFERSFAEFQIEKRAKEGKRDLWRDFNKHLNFLKSEGFVDENDILTEEGVWASQLRLDQPLLIAECLRRNAFPDDEALLAAVVAPFVSDSDQDVQIHRVDVSGDLHDTVKRVLKIVTSMSKRMKSAGFETIPLSFWPAVALYDWAKGVEWEKITGRLNLTDGDLAMLITRTADNLRQISSLNDSHPTMAQIARKARKIILREPVVFE